MTQHERRLFLIRALCAEEERYHNLAIPADEGGQRRLLRSLFNVRLPRPASDEFLAVQDAYLRAEIAARGITDAAGIPTLEPGIALWRGDITTLRCEAIVNAANSGLTGCYTPCHGCIDNAIHTWAGVQLRQACAARMAEQGYPEPVGRAKITPAFNLPAGFVLHTVGPRAQGSVTARDMERLASCYRACLALARENGVGRVAFCCISTGVFGMPRGPAARTAVETVRRERGEIEVIFNVFGEADERIYRELLGGN